MPPPTVAPPPSHNRATLCAQSFEPPTAVTNALLTCGSESVRGNRGKPIRNSAASAAGLHRETRFVDDIPFRRQHTAATSPRSNPLPGRIYSTGKFYAIRITRTQRTADNVPQSALDSGRAEPPETAQNGADQTSRTPTALPHSRIPWRIAGLKRFTSPCCCWR